MTAGSPTSPPGAFHALGWSAILLLAAVQVTAYVDRALPSVLAPLIKAQFGLSDIQIGALQGPAFSTLYAVGLLAAGHLIAGRNPYRVAALCVVAWTAGGVLFALASDYPAMVMGRVLLGLGQAAFAPAALMLLTAERDPGRRARALSTFTTGSAIGGSAALLVGGAALAAMAGQIVLGLEPWRTSSLILMVPNLILAVLLWRAGQGMTRASRDDRPGLGEAFRQIGRQRATLVPIMAAGVFCVLAVQAANAWGSSILHRGFDLTPAVAAMAAGVGVLIAAPLGHLGGGWTLGSRLGQRVGAGPLMAAGMALAALAALGLAASGTVADAVVGLAGVKVGCGFAAVVVLIEIQSLTEPRLRPQVGAVFLALISLVGVGLGPLMTGAISDYGLPGRTGLAWSLAIVTAAAAIVVISLGLIFAGRWRQRAESGVDPVQVGSDA